MPCHYGRTCRITPMFRYSSRFSIFISIFILSLSAFSAAATAKASSPRKVEICMFGATEASACKDSLILEIRADGAMLPKAAYYPSASRIDPFWISLPTVVGVPSYKMNGKYDVEISISHESSQDRFERYMSLPGLPVNRPLGSLIMLRESERGEAGTALLAPQDARTDVLFFCNKPYRATSGKLVENPGCVVRAELSRFVFIEYPLSYKALQDWYSIHQRVMSQVDQAISVKRTIKE